MRRLRPFLAIAFGLVAASCVVQAPSPSPSPDPRAELAGLIQDVTAATAYRYRLSDDHGRRMDTVKVIETGRQVPAFVAVYHSWSDEDSRFHVMVATSDDLLTWAWRTELAVMASQPCIAAVGDGFVVAWEQEPDPIHVVLASYPSLEALMSAVPDRRQDLPVTMPACGEGTPSIDAVTPETVALSFHHHASCERDLQASGRSDWTTWTARQEKDRDWALIELGVKGHIGDRDRIEFGGRDLMLIEGVLVPEDVSTERLFLLDIATKRAEQLPFRTHAGSQAVGNPTIAVVDLHGIPTLVVAVYLFAEGAKGDEDGPLLYYRTLPASEGDRVIETQAARFLECRHPSGRRCRTPRSRAMPRRRSSDPHFRCPG